MNYLDDLSTSTLIDYNLDINGQDVIYLRIPYSKQLKYKIDLYSKDFQKLISVKEALLISSLFSRMDFLTSKLGISVYFKIHQFQTISIFQSYLVGEYTIKFQADNDTKCKILITALCKLGKLPLIEEEKDLLLTKNGHKMKSVQIYPLFMSDLTDQILSLLLCHHDVRILDQEQHHQQADEVLTLLGLDCSSLKLIQCDSVVKVSRLQQVLLKLKRLQQIVKYDYLLLDNLKVRYYRSNTNGYALLSKTFLDKEVLVLCTSYSFFLDEEAKKLCTSKHLGNILKFYVVIRIAIESGEAILEAVYDQAEYQNVHDKIQILIREYIQRLVTFLTHRNDQ